MTLKRELNATSSQDEFAKWAKIRRAHDKKLAEYDEVCMLSPALWKSFPAKSLVMISIHVEIAQTDFSSTANGLKSFKSKFDSTATVIRYISTNGLRFFLQFWYAKRPMFWIPQGWVPGYVEWMLSFPRAPMGSVSIQIWGISCASVVMMVGNAVVAGMVLVRERRTGKRREGMKMRGEGKEKKEL